MQTINSETINHISTIFEIFKNSDSELRPHFMLTGPSGSGKTWTIMQLVQSFEFNYFEINAAQLTKEGTSGNSLSKALTPLLRAGGQPTICFVDEFDKMFISGNCNTDTAHETTNGVQNEFLKVLESKTTEVFHDYGKYQRASVENVLFIFAGAFNGQENITLDDLRDFGIKTEFLGRVGLTFNMTKLTLADLKQILSDSHVLKLYLKLFKNVNRDVVITTIMSALEEHYEKNTLGARMINTLIHQYFIMGGLTKPDVKNITFQRTMELPKNTNNFDDL